MDQKVLDFWRRHSVNFLSMAFETARCERIQHPDGYGKCSRECGDTLEIYLMSRNGRIGSASFYTDGCIYTIACANTLVRMIEGKPIEASLGHFTSANCRLPGDLAKGGNTLR